ncbi:MAG: hypothetical protein A2287_07885 [Candidatus Melainabacteria bacterium RIFOXYA12_FULL_32_12]|nr:MAG: hypothetical protein A2255_08480 [Candidatus Melainabacteria bacterium RIFOXYA2_FULL_32_9]OGI31831.1 MAG: hypothetical protein A2287_07885 [Candidatus Melainabacteria bacterium RIFOXYA12_FULL_32_12]
MTNRRWYDQDPLLKEAMELLSLSSEEEKGQAADFIMKLKEQVAAEVIERVYESVSKYFMKGNRWYDRDPVMIKAMELLRVAPSHIQIAAAKKLLNALSRGEMSELVNEIKQKEENND